MLPQKVIANALVKQNVVALVDEQVHSQVSNPLVLEYWRGDKLQTGHLTEVGRIAKEIYEYELREVFPKRCRLLLSKVAPNI